MCDDAHVSDHDLMRTEAVRSIKTAAQAATTGLILIHRLEVSPGRLMELISLLKGEAERIAHESS